MLLSASVRVNVNMHLFATFCYPCQACPPDLFFDHRDINTMIQLLNPTLKKLNSLRWCLAVTVVAALSLHAVQAQTFPAKPIKIVVPNAAGGAADLTARAVGQKMAEAMGQPVVIDNKPSAGGVVAGDLVAKAEADGYTVLLISSGTAVSASLFKTLPFDTLKDFAPVSTLATFDLAIVVNETGRFKTLADLLAYGKANPGKLNIGTPNIGTTQNLAAELFKASAGIEAQVVPFNGTPPVITALRGGEIDAAIDILGPLMAQINAKAIRAVAVLGDKRATQLPDVPAARESGGALAAFNVSSWNGLAVPAKTPKDVIARLNKEVNAALNLPDVKKRLLDLNLVATGGTPEHAVDVLANDIKRWGDVIARANIAKQ
jgi:tripartite-type tricarboxylate transporter receptor subunit TctC